MKRMAANQKRMSLACLTRAIVAVTVVLLVAAGGLAQTAEAQEQSGRFLDIDRRANQDRHVHQASHEARVGIEERARHTAASASATRGYDVSDVLAKLKREENWADDVSDEQVKQAFVNHLWSFSFNPRTPLNSASQGPDLLRQQTRFAWTGNQLVLSGPEAAHERLVKELGILRKHSFGQVTIEVRMMQGSLDLCAPDAVDATATLEDGSAPWKHRWVLFQQEFANVVSTAISPPGASSDLHSSAQGRPSNVPSARVSMGTSDPILYQVMDDPLFRAFLNHCQGDERNAIVLAPKVTLFDGQTAEISDCSERPFVTDVTKVVGNEGVAYQPVVQVLWEGIKIRLAPTITPKGHRVECQFRFASIDDCKTFRSRYPDAKDVHVQHPVVTTSSLECVVDIPTGQTLLIGGLFPRQIQRDVEQGAISRLLGRQPTEITSSEATYIAITPRTVSAETNATQLSSTAGRQALIR